MDANLFSLEFAQEIGFGWVFGDLCCCENLDDATGVWCAGGEI